MIISKVDFLEKYPFFLETKDNLTIINNLVGGQFVHEGYIIDEFFIPYSHYFWYRGNVNINMKRVNHMLAGSIEWLYEKNPHNKCAMKFELENIQSKEIYTSGELGGGGRGLPQFDINKLLLQSVPVLSEKNRVNKKFNDIMGNVIYKTEFYYQPSDHSLAIEEITDNVFNEQFINRYIHTQFDSSTKKVKHFDGSYLIYNETTNKDRKLSSLDKKLRNATKHIKLFRFDGTIDIDDWQLIVFNYFNNNELIQERFNPIGYKEYYRNILEEDLDY